MSTHRSLVLSFVVVSFAMLTGCGASATRSPSAPAAAMDASWMPSESGDLAINESGREQLRKNTTGTNSYRPNSSSIPQHGAVHAAVY